MGMFRVARTLVCVTLLASVLSCATPETQQPRTVSELDELFARLRTAASAEEAEGIETAIVSVWTRSGDATVDRMMGDAFRAIHGSDLVGAESILDRVVQRAPDFAEGFNMRATVRMLREEYHGAAQDLRRTLSLEPRHFAALVNLGRLFMLVGEDAAALSAFETALEYNPHMPQVRKRVDELRDQVVGVPI